MKANDGGGGGAWNPLYCCVWPRGPSRRRSCSETLPSRERRAGSVGVQLAAGGGSSNAPPFFGDSTLTSGGLASGLAASKTKKRKIPDKSCARRSSL